MKTIQRLFQSLWVVICLLAFNTSMYAAGPTSKTLPATKVTYTSAVLNCFINGGGNFTHVTFKYGLTTNYGNTVTLPMESGSTDVFRACEINGLLPGKTYHYQARSVNIGGNGGGVDMTFTTGSNFKNSGAYASETVFVDASGIVYYIKGNVSGSLPQKVLKGEYPGTTYLGDNPNNKIISVANGAEHILALAANGTVYSFGRNSFGELGDSSSTNRTTPVKVMKGAYSGTRYLGDNASNPIIAIAAGYYFSMALGADGMVYTFGYNDRGQLGDNTNNNRSIPVKVLKGAQNGTTFLGDNATVNPMIAIVAGASHAAALGADGLVYTFGYNGEGQLGNNTTTTSKLPVKVLKGAYSGTTNLGDNNSRRIIKIASGSYHILALSADGLLFAIGSASYGQLGDSSTTYKKIPVKVMKGAAVGKRYFGDSSATMVTCMVAADNHSIVATESGFVYTFGGNNSAQLGDNTTTNSNIPIRVLKGAYSGTTYLGDNSTEQIIGLGVGQTNNFVLTSVGTVYAFGYNGSGQLGDNTTTTRGIPIKVKDVSGTRFLDLIKPIVYTVPANRITYNSAYLNCIINPETNETTATKFEYGLTTAYGNNAIAPQNNSGGNNAFINFTATNLIPGKTYHYRAIVYNSIDTIYGADRVFSTGANFSNTSSTALHSTYIGSDGLLYTFGSNDFGQLGDSNTTSTTTPHKVLKGAYNGTTYLGDNPANPIVAVAGAGRFTLVLAADGIVYTFGRNNYGQLGDNTTTNRLLPVKALKGNYSGTTYLGDNPANPIIYITAGLYNGMALAANGQVFGFGDNSIGQLGDGSNSQRNTAVSVVKGQEYDGTLNLGDNTSNPIISITSGDYHSMALAADGSVYSFGSNDYGQLGNNTSSSNPGVIKVLKGLYPGLRYLGDNNLNPILSITAGQDHSATLAADGTVFTFGRNTYGQLGDTTSITRLTPVYALKGRYNGTKYLGDQISNPIKYIVAGSTHTMVLASNGIVYSFGNNAEGQLGTNASSACDSAVQVLKGTYNGTYSLGDNVANPIISISPLGRSGAALASNGSVYTFGYNGQGQLGDSTTINRTTAVQVKQIGGSGYIDLIGCTASNLLPTQPSTTYVGAYQDTTNGWTQYCDCTGKLLLSLKIGISGAVIMPNEVSLKLGDSTTYSSNSYGGLVKNTNGYAIIDRRWNVSPTIQPTSSVGVKYYFRALEYSKLVSALGGLSSPSTITAITQLNMYKATNGSAYANPHTVNGMILYHDSLASDSTWTYANLGANHTAEFKVNSFSGGGGGGGAGGGSNAAPLPISLLNFDAQLQDKKVYITWSTLDEIGNDYFTIQKSINEINFTDVGQLKANSNSLTQTNYAMIDHNPSKGISYYRLKQTDLTGEFTYTNTKRICHLEQAYVSCYPNPTNGKLSVDLDEETNTYTFINLLGQEILSGRLTKLNNYIDISNCENGQYILFIKNSNQEVTKTLKISKY